MIFYIQNLTILNQNFKMLKYSLLLILILSISNGYPINLEISPTIVNGRNAVLGQFPYMVSFQMKGHVGR